MSVGKRRAPLRSSGPPERRTRVKSVNRKRKAANTKRAYGPASRRAWVKTQPCANCDYGPSPWVEIANAHIKNGGMSRKADARFNIPLCETVEGLGCHQVQHRVGWSALPRLDTPEKREAAAARTEAAWQAHLHQQTGAGTTC